MWAVKDLDMIEQRVQSPRAICEWRHCLLAEGQAGFAASFVPLLEMVIESWFASVQRKPWSNSCTESEEDKEDNICSVCDSRETKALSQALSIHVAISQKDPILAEEIGFQGSHMLLTKLIQFDASMYPEQDQDAIMDLQDLACEIASTASSFPLKLAPISNLHERLPLCISFSPKHTLFIQQVTSRQSAQQDVGFVLWPSAVALSQWLIDHPTLVLTAQSILELGAGCGLVGLTAAMLVQGQKQVDKNGNGVNDENSDPRIILTDFNQVVLDNLRLNIDLNDVQATAQKLDFYQQSGHAEFWVADDSKIGTDSQQEQVDLILAADMICQPSDAVAAANAIHDALKPGGKAIVVCGNGKHRFGVDCFEDECKRVGLTVETSNAIANMESLKLTAGYVEGMSLSMFTIDKI